MPRILLIGKNGQIGWELNRILQNLAEVIAVGRSELDITDHQSVTNIFESSKPNIVINATGYNDVDGAEVHIDNAISVNTTANTLMAQRAKEIKAFYITYSTDYIFDGKKNIAYTEEDLPNPLNIYGKTKLDGELAIKESGADFLVLRTSSVFSLRRPCFLSNFLIRSEHNAQIKVRADLISSPTSASFLAETTASIISMEANDYPDFLSERTGIYHLAGAGSVSRLEWAQETRKILNLNVQLIPASHSDFETGANRPSFSALDSSRLGDRFHIQSVSWKQMLKTTLDELS